MSVRGVGVDVADIDRMAAALRRTPALAERLFSSAELRSPAGRPRPVASLAARFAAKEALAKVLEFAEPGWRLTDVEIETAASGRPMLRLAGPPARRAAELGIDTWHVSLSHDRGTAVAVVIGEGHDPAHQRTPTTLQRSSSRPADHSQVREPSGRVARHYPRGGHTVIVHTLLYRFPERTSDADVTDFFAEMRELVMGTGIIDGFDLRPHLLLGADEGARGMTAQWIVQFTCADLAELDRFSQLPAVFDFVTDWKSRLNFTAAYANHEQLDLLAAAV